MDPKIPSYQCACTMDNAGPDGAILDIIDCRNFTEAKVMRHVQFTGQGAIAQ